MPLLQPGREGLIEGLGCKGDRLQLKLREQSLGFELGELRWRGEAPAGWPLIQKGESPPSGSRWAQSLPDGRVLLMGSWGRGLQKDGRFLEWRAVAGGLKDAIYDDQFVWAVGEHRLWRWRPGAPEALPIPLPLELSGRSFTQIFRDGSLFWLRDTEGQGWPLRFDGAGLSLAGTAGPLPPLKDDLLIPFDGELLRGRRGAPLYPSGEAEPLLAQPIFSVSLLSKELLALGTDEELLIWRAGEGVAQRFHLGGPTLRIFQHQEGLLLVGKSYGFLWLKRSRAFDKNHQHPSQGGSSATLIDGNILTRATATVAAIDVKLEEPRACIT